MIDNLRTLENGKQWQDVSEEVAKEMEALWVSEYGDDWRMKL